MIRILLSARLGEMRWTQADLVRKTGIRPATINEWYHGLVTRIDLDILDTICRTLECDVKDILLWYDENDPNIPSYYRHSAPKQSKEPKKSK